MRLSLLAILFVAACSLPDSHYGTPDAAPPQIDAPEVSIDARPDASPVKIDVQESLDVNEGASQALAVKLSAAPAGPVVVAVTDTAGKLQTSPATLTFTPTSYATAQVVTVTAPADADTVDNIDTLVLSATGLADASVGVQIHDDDVEQILTATAPITLDEGQSTTLFVHLSAPPASASTVSISSSSTAAVTGSPVALTFTATDYAVDKVVTLVAPQDADAISSDAKITLSSPGLAPQIVSVHVNDDDVAAIVTDAVTPLTLVEGESTTLKVHLSAQPPSNQIVTVTAGKLSVAPTTLTFTPASYATDQVVTVTALQDADVLSEDDTIVLSSAGLTPVNVAAHIVDNDDLAIMTSVSSLTIDEGATKPFAVVLTFQPPANVVVQIASGDVASDVVSPVTLTFTPANYNTAQTVTVSSVHDTNTLDEATVIHVAATGLPPKTITVTNHDTGP
jgi:hypothetical protein